MWAGAGLGGWCLGALLSIYIDFLNQCFSCREQRPGIFQYSSHYGFPDLDDKLKWYEYIVV